MTWFLADAFADFGAFRPELSRPRVVPRLSKPGMGDSLEVEVAQAVIDVLQSDRVDFNCWKGAIILSAIPPSRVLQAQGLAAAPRIGRGYIFGGKVHASMRFGGCAAHGALVSRMRRACGVAFNP